MSELLGSIWWLLVSLGILVTFHELGHYWVARRAGVKVLRFSVGFGKPLWSRRARDGTEWVVAALPLGGYVKMLDEAEGEVPAEFAAQAFNRQGVGKRMAIAAAGPVANLVLCVALFWLMFVIGRPDYAPAVGSVDGIAAEAGLRRGDTIDTVSGHPTPSWSELQMALLPHAIDREDVDLEVRDAQGRPRELGLPLSRIPAGLEPAQLFGAIGLRPRHQLLPPVVGRLEPGLPAASVLREGDRIVALDGRRIEWFDDLGAQVQAAGRAGHEVMIEVMRDGQRHAFPITPQPREEANGARRWVLGLAPDAPPMPDYDAEVRHAPVAAVAAALRETTYQARQLVGMLARAVTGQVASRDTLAGPITIARASNAFARQGPAWYLQLLALLSLGLAVLNLLPIPLLDGGHLLYYLIELVKGSPLSERAMAAGQYLGLALIAGLMGLAFYNDILNNFFR